MSTLTIKSGSSLGNKGNITLNFSNKEEKKLYVKNKLKGAKQAQFDGTEQLKAVVEQQQFESELEAWAIEQGCVLVTDKPVHYEPIRFLSFSATKSAKVRRLAEFMSVQEWNCKILSSVTMKKLGLKGSPKLSKVLVSLGVSNKKVELMLGGSLKSVQSSNVSYVTCDEAYIEDQGNSIYYSSCQATDDRARWSGDDSYNRIDQDLEAWGLFLWCIGDPMHIDGKGYIARAKLRLLTDSYSEVCGLYIDRPYGAHQLLMDNVQDLVDWWSEYCIEQGYGDLAIFLAPNWQREDGEGADFEYRFGGRSKSMYCRSAEEGYQDTMNRGYGPYSFFKRLGVESGSWLKRAYLARPKQDNVYLCSLKDVDYNSQKAAFVTPNVIDKAWRGFITNDQKDVAYTFIKYLGMPDSKFEFDSNNQVLAKYSNKTLKGYKSFYGIQFNYDHRTFLDLRPDKAEVFYSSLKELGFEKAEQLPYSYSYEYNSSKKQINVADLASLRVGVLTVDRTEHGFVRAVSADIPVNCYGEVVVNRDGFSYPVALPYLDQKGNVYIPSAWSNQYQYVPNSVEAKNDLSIFPWAVGVEFPYNIKGDTLTVTENIEGYYAKAESLENQPFELGFLNNYDDLGRAPKLQVTRDIPEYGYAVAEIISTWKITTFKEVYWRQRYVFNKRAYSYQVKVVDVSWPEEGYMPPCSLEDAPVKVVSNKTSWQDVFDIEDDVYGDRVLNRLPDPYFSEEVIDEDYLLFD